MAQRLVEQKTAINQYAIENGDIDMTLNANDWALLEELITGIFTILIVKK